MTTPDTPAPQGRRRTLIYLLVDRSGSMERIASDVVGGINAFFDTQREAGTDGTTATLIQFDSQDPHHVLWAGRPLAEVRPIGPGDFVPRGGTPLLDAIGRAIGLVDREVAEADAIGAEILVEFAIVTDGEENSSTEFRLDAIRQMIEDRRARGWTVSYLSADANAFADAQQMGIALHDTAQFRATGPEARGAIVNMSRAMSDRRTAWGAGSGEAR